MLHRRAGRTARPSLAPRLQLEALEAREVPAAFTEGNLVVLRIGDGSTTLSNAASVGALVELTTTGSNPTGGANVIALPSFTTGGNNQGGITLSGSTNSAAGLNLSSDGRYLTTIGYDAQVGTADVRLTTASAANRTVALIAADGNVSIVARLNNTFSGDSARAVVTTDGTSFYATGAGSSPSIGVRYFTYDGTNPTTTSAQIANPNARQVNIVGGNLVFDQAASISRFSGLPTASATQTSLGLSLNDAHQFVFLDRAAGVGDANLGGEVDTLYIANNGATNSLAKYFWNGTAWAAAGSATISGGLFGLTGVVSGSSAALYATTNTTSNNSLVAFTDSAAYDATLSGSFSVLATAGANYWFRGVAFAPTAAQNQSPVVTLNGGDASFTENATEPTVLASAATVTDADSADFDTGTLTVEFTANGTSNDRLAIRNEGTSAGQIGVSGSNVTYGGTSIGTFTGGTGTTPLVVTLNSSADATATQTLVRNITYSNVSESPSTADRTVRFTLTDGDGGTSDAVTRTVTVTAVNDAPTVTAPVTATTNEDTALVFSEANGNVISVADVDAGSGSITVTLAATHGTVTLSSTTNLNVSGNGTATVTLSGALADVNAGLNGLTYNPDSNYNGSAEVQVTANDNGNTGTGGALTDSKTVTLTVTSVNDAPAGTNRSATIDEDTTYTFATTDFGFTDPNDSPSNAFAGIDVTTLPTSGTLALNGTAVSAGDFVSATDLESGLLVFTPVADGFGIPYATFIFQVRDDGDTANGGQNTDQTANTFTLNVNAVNDAPVVTTSTGPTSYTENASGLVVDPSLVVADIDNTTLASARVAISTNFVVGQDVLDFTPTSGITGNYDTNTGVLTLAGSASVIAYQTALRSVTYTNSSDNPSTLTRTLSFTVNDGALDSAVATKDVTVIAVNDAPVVTAPTTVSTDEDTSFVFSTTNTISVFDADASELQLTLTATKGTLTLGGTSGVTVSGNGSTSVTLSGTISALNTALEGTTFNPDANYPGAATVTIVATDNGSSGTGGILTDTKSIQVTVNSVNDAPVGTSFSVTTNEDTAYTFAVSDFQFSDPNDAPANAFAGIVVVSLPTAGELALNGTAVTTDQFVSASEVADGKLKFTPATNDNGTPYSTFMFRVRDDGGTSPGVDLDTVARTVTINVTAVNDAPSVTLSKTDFTTTVGTATTQNGFAIFAPGGGADELTQTAQNYTVTPANGALFAVAPTIDTSGQLTFTASGTTGTTTVTVTVTDSAGATSSEVQFSVTVQTVPVPASPQEPVNVTVDPTARFIAAGADAGSNGTVRLFDARTGTPIASFQPFGNYSGGVNVALGDLTGDGVAELAVATRGNIGLLAVYNLATGATLVSPVRPFGNLNTGLQIASGDVDGDGVQDLVISPERGATTVFGFSFTKGALVTAFEAVPGASANYQFAVGDVSGDSRAEVILSANGVVGVFGSNGGLLSAFTVAPGFTGDMSLAVGDTNGDGRREIVVALQGPGANTGVGAFSTEGALVWSLFADTGAGLRRDGTNRPAVPDAPSVAVADVTGDGIADILLGSQTGMGTSRITIVNGATRQAVRTDIAFDALSQIGVFTDAG